MTPAKQGDTVQTHYIGKLDDGTVFHSSEGNEPLEFIIGTGQVIPGYEQGVVGMDLGESKTITIPVNEAYGPRRDDMILVLGREEFPPEMDPKVGEKLEMHQPDGAVALVTVLKTSPESVTIDANHPLAGHALVFDVKLVGVRSRPQTRGL
ncbi:MAG: peptidylprolyl isomerase [Actinomycetota bacterium]|nr:peptidylprolyl isomerase [Actinomycetota bacterium]